MDSVLAHYVCTIQHSPNSMRKFTNCKILTKQRPHTHTETKKSTHTPQQQHQIGHVYCACNYWPRQKMGIFKNKQHAHTHTHTMQLLLYACARPIGADQPHPLRFTPSTRSLYFLVAALGPLHASLHSATIIIKCIELGAPGNWGRLMSSPAE